MILFIVVYLIHWPHCMGYMCRDLNPPPPSTPRRRHGVWKAAAVSDIPKPNYPTFVLFEFVCLARSCSQYFLQTSPLPVARDIAIRTADIQMT